ncbi:MAG: transposase [Nitrospira sp.]|nr:transposase [Nitrospira sp.]
MREHFPEEHIPEGRLGRKPVPARAVLEAVLWILNTGAEWHMLPPAIPTTKRGIDGSSSGTNARCCAPSSHSWRTPCARRGDR